MSSFFSPSLATLFGHSLPLFLSLHHLSPDSIFLSFLSPLHFSRFANPAIRNTLTVTHASPLSRHDRCIVPHRIALHCSGPILQPVNTHSSSLGSSQQLCLFFLSLSFTFCNRNTKKRKTNSTRDRPSSLWMQGCVDGQRDCTAGCNCNRKRAATASKQTKGRGEREIVKGKKERKRDRVVKQTRDVSLFVLSFETAETLLDLIDRALDLCDTVLALKQLLCVFREGWDLARIHERRQLCDQRQRR